MKGMKFSIGALCAAMLLSGCSMSNTAKGGLIGGGGGGALGALIGQLAGGGKGAAIGAAIGTTLGAGAGVIIGNKMDKAKKAAEAANAKAEIIEGNDGISYVLNSSAKNDLATFAKGLDSDMDLCIYGYTDNDPWRGSTAAESKEKNKQLSLMRASSVRDFLLLNGVTSSQIRELSGLGEENPISSNSTPAGKEQNRRVEVYILPSKAMIEAANKAASEK